VESLISYAVVILVVARAVNVLGAWPGSASRSGCCSTSGRTPRSGGCGLRP